MTWPNDRWEELQQLRQLLNEVQAINSGSHVIERVQRCMKLAEKLDRSDLANRHTSFVQFLTTLAIEEQCDGDNGGSA